MTGSVGQWILLAYRIPSRPSTPRIAIWRRLDRLGVARLGDGLVALPADARTREELDWVADEVERAGGSATVWLAVPGSTAQERAIATAMRRARAAEYEKIIGQARAAAGASPGDRARIVGRLRGDLRRIGRRDFFPPVERDAAQRALHDLSEQLSAL